MIDCGLKTESVEPLDERGSRRALRQSAGPDAEAAGPNHHAAHELVVISEAGNAGAITRTVPRTGKPNLDPLEHRR